MEAAFVFSLWKDPARYDDYKGINANDDKTLQTEDGIFYFRLGQMLREQGFQTIDNITVATFLETKPGIRDAFESMGGWKECDALMQLVDPDNADGYFDKIARMNSLSIMCKKCDEMFSDVGRFSNATNDQVYDAFDLLNNQVSLTTGHDAKVERLIIDESYIRECDAGDNVGLNYSKGAPLLNYLTLGIPRGDMTLLAGHSGAGKSSFIFESILLPIAQGGTKVAIISNEMQAKAYQNLLTIHILTHDLNYWKLTRKKLKTGHFTDEELQMLHQVEAISKEKYNNIIFVKMFENNTGKTLKYIKRLARTGVGCFLYDTMKSDDDSDDKMWQQLLMNSRRIFNVVSKENIAFIATFQLALSTTNFRWLDAQCLSNSKQIKEVVSELIMIRRLWQDEYTGERFDCKPWRRDKENPKIKVPIELDPDKIYIVAFLNKTRNDEDGQTVLYEWQAHFNIFKELGYCKIVNEHKTFN